MKKILLLTLITIMVFACSEKSFKIGILYQDDSEMGDRVVKGFETFLTGKENIETEIFNAKGNEETFKMILQKLGKSKDAVLVLRSKGAEWAKKHSYGKTPIITAACNNPKMLGVIENLEKPEANITACSYFISPDKQINTIKKLFPEIKKIAYLYQEGHPGAEKVTIPIIEKTASELNIELLMYSVKSKFGEGNIEEAQNSVKTAKEDGSELIIISNTNSVYTAADSIIAEAGDTPVYSFSDEGMKPGVFGGLISDDLKLGKFAGEYSVEIKNNKTISELPVKFDDSPKLKLSKSKTEQLKVEIPEDLKNSIIWIK